VSILPKPVLQPWPNVPGDMGRGVRRVTLSADGIRPATAGVGAVCTALFFLAGFHAPLHAGEASLVTAHQLRTPVASGKVEAVLWTRRAGGYTLQFVFPRPSVGMRIEPQSRETSVTLWLLRADGTAIPVSASPAQAPRKGQPRSDLTFPVSIADGESAVAAAIRIDDAYFIEALQPLAGE